MARTPSPKKHAHHVSVHSILKSEQKKERDADPEADFPTINRRIGARWKALSAADKLPWEKEFARLKVEDPNSVTRKRKMIPSKPRKQAAPKKPKANKLKVVKKAVVPQE